MLTNFGIGTLNSAPQRDDDARPLGSGSSAPRTPCLRFALGSVEGCFELEQNLQLLIGSSAAMSDYVGLDCLDERVQPFEGEARVSRPLVEAVWRDDHARLAAFDRLSPLLDTTAESCPRQGILEASSITHL
jgi:hypothetical protein